MTDFRTWGLELQRSELTWEGCSLCRLAREYETPLYVVGTQALDEAATRIREAFESQGLSASIFFSYKTNPIPEVLRRLAGHWIGAEVISEVELSLAKRLGLQGDEIVVGGATDSPSLLRMAVETGAAMITVQTIAELSALEKAASELGRAANIGLRINPGLKKRLFNFTAATGSRSSPIGFLLGSEEWQKAISIIKNSTAFRFRGLHFHIGSGIAESHPYREAIKKTLAFIDELLKQGLVLEILDIGGGFGVSTLKEINLWEAVRLFGWNKPQKPPRTKPAAELLSEVARISSVMLQEYATKQGLPLPRIFIEPGRAMTASSQLLLLTVRSVVKRKRKTAAAVCDGGAMSLSPLLLTEYHSLFVANKAGQKSMRKYDVYGSLPTPLDLVVAQRELPLLSPGDILAVMDTGAYFTSLGNNFAGARPAVVMLEGGSARLIRRRETFDDLFARDKIFQLEKEK